jgi:hypothetical protein
MYLAFVPPDKKSPIMIKEHNIDNPPRILIENTNWGMNMSLLIIEILEMKINEKNQIKPVEVDPEKIIEFNFVKKERVH